MTSGTRHLPRQSDTPILDGSGWWARGAVGSSQRPEPCSLVGRYGRVVSSGPGRDSCDFPELLLVVEDDGGDGFREALGLD